MPGPPVDSAVAKLAQGGRPITNAQREAVEVQLGLPNTNIFSQYVDYLATTARSGSARRTRSPPRPWR